MNGKASAALDEIVSRIPENARWFDIIEVQGVSTPIVFKNNRLYSLSEKQNSGFGVRINIDGRTGFSYTNDRGNLAQTVRRASELAPFGEEERFDLPATATVCLVPFDPAIAAFSHDREIAQGAEAIRTILQEFPKASVNLSISASTGAMALANSEGLSVSYESSHYGASISSSYVQEDGVKVDVWESVSSLAPVPYPELARRIIEKTRNALVVGKLPAGKIPVLFTPKALARLLGLVVSGFNGKTVWKGISHFAGKRGEKLFSEGLGITDDPCVPGSPYSYPFDDEGTPGRGTKLIDRGVVADFITDLKYAQKLSLPPTGNGMRGYSSLPGPSFSNVVIEPGLAAYESMLAGIDRGILVDQFIGLGQSNTLVGDFSANLDLAYIVEKGKITGRVKDCMLTDNIFRLLAGEFAFSIEREWHGAMLVPAGYFPGVDFTG